MTFPCTNLRNRKNELPLNPHGPHRMNKENIRYVGCAHCEARVRLEEAVSYQSRLIYAEHDHCKECDPDGVWDCVSHDFDTDLH